MKKWDGLRAGHGKTLGTYLYARCLFQLFHNVKGSAICFHWKRSALQASWLGRRFFPGQAIERRGRKRGQVRRTGAGLFCCVPGSFEHQPGGIWSRSRHGGFPWLPQHSMAGMLYKNAGIEGGSKGRLRPRDSAARNWFRNDAMSHTLTAEWRRLADCACCVLMAVVFSDRNL